MKSRKTRKEKMIADLRRKNQLLSFPQNTPSQNNMHVEFSLPKTKFRPENKAVPLNSYPYLIHDLLKTFILTSSILIVEILIYIFSKNRIIFLPIKF